MVTHHYSCSIWETDIEGSGVQSQPQPIQSVLDQRGLHVTVSKTRTKTNLALHGIAQAEPCESEASLVYTARLFPHAIMNSVTVIARVNILPHTQSVCVN